MHSPEQKIKQLRTELKQLEESYYSGREELVSDDLYDYKLRELAALERQNPDLITEDSPTQRVGFYNSGEINIRHEVPMLSINNAFSREDLDAYFTSCEKSDETKIPEYILEPKIDGVSISLIYENGYLKKSISRGDGESGEDLTNKILNIGEIPIRISSVNPPKRLVIRGEIYVTKSDFKQIQEEGKSFANPRNYVAGTLRLKESEKLKNKKLRLCVYQMLYPENLNIQTQSQVLATLSKLGFPIYKNFKVLRDKEEIYKYIEDFGNRKESMDIPMDGLVLKVNQLSLLDEIGYTSKFPKWAVAYKYPSLIKESKLLEIFPTVGRTGKITYSAKVEPVEINGSVVQYATLHNADYIKNLDLRMGDYVGIYKSGEVVPRVIGFNLDRRDPQSIPWEPITHCPSCGMELEERDNLKTQYCPNEDCIEKRYAKLAHWCSREAADIEGLSIQITTKLSQIGILNRISDIYRLKEHRDLVINANIKIKEKSFNNIIEAIEKSKDREWRFLLFGLGINFIGEESAALISRKYKSIQELMNADIQEIKKIDGIGDKGAESIFNWFKNNREFMEELMGFGLFKPSKEIEKIEESFITGKRVVITGKLSKSRMEISHLLSRKYGAIVQGEVSAKTDYLVAGLQSGSKLKKAVEKGVEVISEEDLFKKLGLS